MTLIAKRSLRHGFHRRIQIGVGINHHGIFTTHFQNRALDPQLAGLLFGSALVDVQANAFGARERDVTRLRMRDNGIAKG